MTYSMFFGLANPKFNFALFPPQLQLHFLLTWPWRQDSSFLSDLAIIKLGTWVSHGLDDGSEVDATV